MGRYIPQNNDANIYKIADLLLAIEAKMRELQVWGKVSPDPEGLASKLPFCGDTLTLEQWLQWIFIPRMKLLLESGKSLPRSCDISPYAREVWRQRQDDMAPLINILREFDELIFRLNEPGHH